MKALTFIHGWGFDAGLWDDVATLLPDFAIRRLDRGYFGAGLWERPADSPDSVIVGHSLGAMLAARQWPDLPLVAVNGFDRFCGVDGVAPRVLARMRARLAQDAAPVLADFRTRLGAGAAPAIAAPDRLAEDLAVLADESAAPERTAPLLVLQAADDPLLPEALRQTTFGGAAAHTLPQGGHLLPLTRPDWVAAQIRSFP